MPMLRIALPDSSRLPRNVPIDVGAFCPRYYDQSFANRAIFWRELLYQMMKWESGYRPALMFWEGTEYSVGLLQMSLSNGCVRREQELTDPQTNIACAVKRMERLVAPEGQPVGRIGGSATHGTAGAARYWSTLRVAERKPGGGGKETRARIIDATKKLRICWTSPAS